MTISKFLMYVIVIMFLIFLGTVAWLAFVLVKKMPKKLPTIALITSFVLTIIFFRCSYVSMEKLPRCYDRQF
ncbi:hypothetical protein [Paucilactobacillus hokkaidonensis]|uniref:hypothetical protein n=1 Tax=Paucilactobacillus hokkaidonensis TaxID=1193095 RepID=UPI0006D10919|nr:hypothetical protein [Paucilactobacillus hokkaidonensis]